MRIQNSKLTLTFKPSGFLDLRYTALLAAPQLFTIYPRACGVRGKNGKDSLFVPGVSKQMNILSRLGIKVVRFSAGACPSARPLLTRISCRERAPILLTKPLHPLK
jgi:hypothetical protein